VLFSLLLRLTVWVFAASPVLLIFLIVGCTPHQVRYASFSPPEILQKRLKSFITPGMSPEYLSFLRQLYQERSYHPLWIYNGKLTEKADILLSKLGSSKYEGLFPSDFPVDDIMELYNQPSLSRRMEVDIFLTYSAILY